VVKSSINPQSTLWLAKEIDMAENKTKPTGGGCARGPFLEERSRILEPVLEDGDRVPQAVAGLGRELHHLRQHQDDTVHREADREAGAHRGESATSTSVRCCSDRGTDCDSSPSSQGDSRHVEYEFRRRQWSAYLLQCVWHRQAAHSSSRGINPDSFGSNLTELAKDRQVIAVHLQAHGRTPDTDRPLRCESLGDDVAALIGHLNLGKADVMGYLFGSGVALQTAIRHPEVVDRLVLVAARMKQDGSYPEVVAAFNQLEANAAMIGPGVKASPLGQAYPDVDWTTCFARSAT
jgi:hypothetical protein